MVSWFICIPIRWSANASISVHSRTGMLIDVSWRPSRSPRRARWQLPRARWTGIGVSGLYRRKVGRPNLRCGPASGRQRRSVLSDRVCRLLGRNHHRFRVMLPAERIADAGDDQIAERHRGRIADAQRRAVDEAEERSTAPAAANRAAQSNFRSMIKAAMAPRINPASTAPPPSRAIP